MTVVMMCSCKHDFQDKEYGNKRRLFNLLNKTKKGQAKCTVCNNIRNV